MDGCLLSQVMRPGEEQGLLLDKIYKHEHDLTKTTKHYINIYNLNTSQSPLLRLPQELRVRILQHIYGGPISVIFNSQCPTCRQDTEKLRKTVIRRAEFSVGDFLACPDCVSVEASLVPVCARHPLEDPDGKGCKLHSPARLQPLPVQVLRTCRQLYFDSFAAGAGRTLIWDEGMLDWKTALTPERWSRAREWVYFLQDSPMRDVWDWMLTMFLAGKLRWSIVASFPVIEELVVVSVLGGKVVGRCERGWRGMGFWKAVVGIQEALPVKVTLRLKLGEGIADRAEHLKAAGVLKGVEGQIQELIDQAKRPTWEEALEVVIKERDRMISRGVE